MALLTVIIVFISIVNVYVAAYSADTSKTQSELAKESLLQSVIPKLHFQIRPANDFWTTGNNSSWMPGVGLYIESLGNGPSFI